MPNRYYSDINGRLTGGQGGSNKAQGAPAKITMPEGTANWPGLPGKSGPDRSGGAPKQGKLGKFTVFQR